MCEFCSAVVCCCWNYNLDKTTYKILLIICCESLVLLDDLIQQDAFDSAVCVGLLLGPLDRKLEGGQGPQNIPLSHLV